MSIQENLELDRRLSVLLPPGGGYPAEEIQQVLITAAADYIDLARRQGQTEIELTDEGLRTALAVIKDGLELAKQKYDLADLPTNKSKLKKLIGEGLKLRDETFRQGAALLSRLDDPSGVGSSQDLWYDLGLKREAVRAAKRVSHNFKVTPDLSPLRKLAALANERLTLAPTLALAVTEDSLGLPPDPTDGDKQGLRKGYFPDLSRQASLIRGKVTSGALEKVSPEFRVDPLFFRLEDLETLAAQARLGEFSQETVAAAAGEIAARVFPSRYELVAPAEATLKGYGGQVIDKALSWQARGQPAADKSPMYPLIIGEHFSDLPVVPFTAEYLVVSTEGLEGVLSAGKPHLWQEAVILKAGGNELAVPSPAVLAIGLLGLRRGGAAGTSEMTKNLEAGLTAWRRFYQTKNKNPGKIANLDERISQLDKPPTDILIIDPQITTTALLRLNGSIAADSRRLKKFARAKENNARLLESLLTQESGKPVDSGRLQRKQAIMTYLEIQQEKLSAMTQSTRGSLEKIAGELAREGTWLNIFDFDSRPAAIGKPTDAFRLPTENELSAKLKLAESIKRQLETDASVVFPTAFPDKIDRLRKFLEWRINHPMLGKLRSGTNEKIDIGLRILRGNPNDIGVKFWREWILAETEREIKRLTTAIGFHRTLDGLETRNRGVTDCLEAVSDYQTLMRRCERNLPEIDSLGRWLRAITVDEEVIKRPDLKRHWNQAQQLIRSFGDLSGGISFSVPAAADFDSVIGKQRTRPAAKGSGSKKSEAYRQIEALADQMRPASRPGSRTLPPKSVIFNKFLDLLVGAVSNQNPLVPVELTAGMTLKELIEATAARTNVVEACLFQDEVTQKREQSRQLADKLRTNVEWQETARTLAQAQAKRERLTAETTGADGEIVIAMRRAGLAIDDPKLVEAIKKAAKKSKEEP